MKKTLAYCVTCDFPLIEMLHGDPLAERVAEDHVRRNTSPAEDHVVELKTIVRRDDS